MALDPLPKYQKAAYRPIAPRAHTERTSPVSRGWGDPCREGILVVVKFAPRPRDGYTFSRQFRAELSPLLKYLVDATHELGAPSGFEFRRNAELGGGFSTYNCREIKGGSTQQSWHSWPVAADINSAGNPLILGDDPDFVSRQPPWMVDLWESAGWYWGGRYTGGRIDAMHFEYLRSPADVAADLVNARAAYDRIKAELNGAAPLKDVQVNGEGTVTPEQVMLLQRFLNENGANPQLIVDGVFGPKTEAALAQVAQLIRSQKEAIAMAKKKGSEIAAL
jgi:hypothetical protein